MTRLEAIRFRKLLDNIIGKLTEEEALEAIWLFEPWKVGQNYKIDNKRRYDDKLYICKQAHKSQVDWNPSIAVSLWTEIKLEEWPEWYIRYGEGWPFGAKVTRNGHKWISTYPANTWEPGVFGWDLYE